MMILAPPPRGDHHPNGPSTRREEPRETMILARRRPRRSRRSVRRKERHPRLACSRAQPRARLQSVRHYLLASLDFRLCVVAVAHPGHAVVPEELFERRVFRKRRAQRSRLLVVGPAVRAPLVCVGLASGGGRGIAALRATARNGAFVPGSARRGGERAILLAARFELRILFPQLALHADELALQARLRRSDAEAREARGKGAARSGVGGSAPRGRGRGWRVRFPLVGGTTERSG